MTAAPASSDVALLMNCPASKHTIVGIHGVGTPGLGSISSAINANLKNGNVAAEVIEFNWNKLSEQSVRENNLSWEAVEYLATCLASACLPLRSNERFGTSGTGRVLDRFRESSFRLAETAMAVWFTTFVFVLPLLAIVLKIALSDWKHDVTQSWITRDVLVGMYFTFITGLSLFLLSSCVISILRRELSEVLVAIRRVAIVLLRPLVLIAVVPFLIPWGHIVRSTWKVMIGILVLSFTLMFAGDVAWFLYDYVHGYKAFLSWFVDACLSIYGLLAIAIMFALSLIVSYLLGPTLKVMLDIFRYAVDAGAFRRRLQESLAKVINNIEVSSKGQRSIVLIAHSLGSVIAIDSLVNQACWKPGDVITLFTLGSPLKRFFFRFFPTLFFPSSALVCAQVIASRVSGFRWLNCYRPWDQVGMSLGFPTVAGLNDKCTGQFNKFFTAHLNYWKDPLVRNLLYQWFNLNQWLSTPTRVAIRPMTCRSTIPHRTLASSFLLWCAGIAIILIPILTVSLNMKALIGGRRRVDTRIQSILRTGMSSTADVTCEDTKEVGYNYVIYTDIFTFKFVDRDGNYHSVEDRQKWIRGEYLDDNRRIDPEKLSEFIKAKQGAKAIVTVRYLADDPNFIVVPDFIWRASLFAKLAALFWVLLGGFLCFGLCILASIVSFPWLRLLIGQPVFNG